MDVVTALHSEYPDDDIPGLYPVSKLAKRFEITGIPFVILIDACYEHSGMEYLRETYSLTQSGDYFGPDPNGGADETREFTRAIKQFAAAPYLRDTNPVIFSSTPGTAAIEVLDPKPSWRHNRYVAPLARSIYMRFEDAIARSQALNWGSFLQSIVDVKPIGEMQIEGTFSWSDFSSLREIPILEISLTAGKKTADQSR